MCYLLLGYRIMDKWLLFATYNLPVFQIFLQVHYLLTRKTSLFQTILEKVGILMKLTLYNIGVTLSCRIFYYYLLMDFPTLLEPL